MEEKAWRSMFEGVFGQGDPWIGWSDGASACRGAARAARRMAQMKGERQDG